MDKTKYIINYLSPYVKHKYKVGIILGSGLNHVADKIEGKRIPYSAIPNLPVPSVPGHQGNLILGKIKSTPVIVCQGRIHYYETLSWEKTVFLIRLLHYWGITKLILTSAVGSLNPDLKPGELILITDHINFMGGNPLQNRRANSEDSIFVNLSNVYSPTLLNLINKQSQSIGIKLTRGIYLAVSGPVYETKAEVNAYHRLGGDIIGMSVVPEAVYARYLGMQVVAICYVANSAGETNTSHTEVLKVGHQVSSKITRILNSVIPLVK